MFYNYLFYSIYKFTLKTPKNDDPVFMTIFMMTLPVGANFISLYSTLEKMFQFPELNSFIMGALILSTALLNYLIYWRNDRYFEVIKKIESHSLSKRKKWKTIMILYFIMTIILYFTLSYTSEYIPYIL
ncbi:MAG: hypothetical protein P8Q14_11055 [Vicingaceae bacterium]|nr:hypothetical protein [Vicingaceae bacterium]